MSTFSRTTLFQAILDRGFQSYRNVREKVSPALNKAEIQKYDTFVLKRMNHSVGVGSNIQLYCGAIDFIRKTVPSAKIVIDLQTFSNTLLEAAEVGKVNGWERLFHQPDDISLEVKTGAAESISNHPKTLVVDNLEPFDRVWYRDLPTDSITGVRINKWRRIYQNNIRMREDIKRCRSIFQGAV